MKEALQYSETEGRNFSREELVTLLSLTDADEIAALFKEAFDCKIRTRGDKVYLRGLIEISNICRKNCLYCGLRHSNISVRRYELDDETVLKEAGFAYDAGYGSVVIQGGERRDGEFISRIESLLRGIKKKGNIGITLSLGEQTDETYRRWFEAGAHRYLLRIESSDRNLYARIHPDNNLHSFDERLACLESLKKNGYKVGTGVMIGLPFQTFENLADDLLFFKETGVDMVGMGPYLEHDMTPLYEYRNLLMSGHERLLLSLKMVALLRLMMPDINIAATTAMQVLDPYGREKAIMAGANVLMPNMTDPDNRENYQIYNNKPGINDDAEITKSKIIENLESFGIRIGWNEWGDARPVDNRQ